MESVVNTFLSYFTSPLNISEAILDHDYTLQAMSRCGESSKDLWVGLVATSRKIESLVSEPIRAFIHEDLRNFKVTSASSFVVGGELVSYPALGDPSHPRTGTETL